jgi:large subunit ribosomal protein L21
MYAVIETGSKQYRVEVGTELQVELLDVEPGQTITLDRVLLVADGDTSAIGRPVVDGAKVTAEVVRRERGVKTISFKYRPKARRRVKKGHRQELTILRVDDIVLDGKSAAKEVRAAEAAAKTERQRLEEAAARQAAEDKALAAKLAKAAAPKDEAEAAPAKGRGAKKTTNAPKAGATKTATDARTDAKSSTAKGAAAKPTARADTKAKPATTAKPSADASKRSASTKKDK